MFLIVDMSIIVKISFLINLFYIGYIAHYNIYKEQSFSPLLGVFVVFNILFFIIAPLIQIDYIVTMRGYTYGNGGSFIQNYPYIENEIIQINLYIFLFNLIFFNTYKFLNKIKIKPSPYYISYNNLPKVILILVIISILIVLINVKTIIFQFQNDFYKEVEISSTSAYMLVQKFLFFIPLSGLILAYKYLKITNNKKSKNYFIILLLFVFFLGLVFILKNPLTEKRNALGPIYILVLYLLYKNILNTNYKVMRFMIISMVIIFPLLTVITHSRNSLTQMINKPSIIINNFEYLHVSDAFNSLHYDAYPNFLATVDYFHSKEIIYGDQLAPTFLFFVPRSIWKGKPEVTGFKIGNYLIRKYKFNWKNLSNPYISEGYINFGFVGIILFAIILAGVFVFFIRWLKSDDILKNMFSFYFAIYLMYFLRGDLANGFAYFVSYLMAMYVVPKIIFLLVNSYDSKTTPPKDN